MSEDKLRDLFEDTQIVNKIKSKLPVLFKIAELSVSRGSRVGMEIGTLREQIIVALFIYKYGRDAVDTNIPPNEKEVDVFIKGHKNPISIKTKSGKGYSGVKLIWTVDWKQVDRFLESYYPRTDMIYVNVVWGKDGVFSYIPLHIQEEVFKKLGRERYIKLPRKGTNPRGVEISSEALRSCLSLTPYKIPIEWVVDDNLSYDPYGRWVELWEKS